MIFYGAKGRLATANTGRLLVVEKEVFHNIVNRGTKVDFTPLRLAAMTSASRGISRVVDDAHPRNRSRDAIIQAVQILALQPRMS